MDVRVIITAGGSGSRFCKALPKQFAKLGTDSILEHTVRCFEICDHVKEITVVLPPDFMLTNERICYVGARLASPAHHDTKSAGQASLVPTENVSFSKLRHVVSGKNTRAKSVYEGLLSLSQGSYFGETIVLVHDGVRPFVSDETIKNVAEMAFVHGAAIAATKVTDTIKKVDAEGYVSETISRDSLWRASTPQGFRIGILLESYKKAIEEGFMSDATDEAFLAEKAGYPVYVVEGNHENIKITTPADKLMAETILRMRG